MIEHRYVSSSVVLTALIMLNDTVIPKHGIATCDHVGSKIADTLQCMTDYTGCYDGTNSFWLLPQWKSGVE